ncbi:NAD-dependent deacylase [Anaerolineae bacterium CFX9]|nr:NAD-dependent deacylase [Kamptonema cortianum]MDL1900837.1 NAD-dependent deacylase [Anaerolineae bacterium CFX9]
MTGDADRIREIASLLRYAQSAVAFTGAGMSTASGIPDFRSPKSGLWNNVDPMAVASIYGFRQNPRAFFDWVYPITAAAVKAQPNTAHLALARLESLNIIKAVITQNIDMLHMRAGSRRIYELHGHLREATCTHCFRIYPGEPLLEKFMIDREVPRCADCGGVIKPNVILFGEQLPHEVFHGAQDVAKRADIMLVLGSSLEVAPASDLPMLTWKNGGKVIIVNLEPTPLDRIATVVVRQDVTKTVPALLELLEQR